MGDATSGALRARRIAGALVLALGLGARAVTGCSVDVGDQACTEESVTSDRTDRCPYGPPGGPRVTGGECPAIALEPDLTKCTVTWEGDVFPMFSDPERGNCTADGCHGARPGAKGVYLPASDAQSAYLELKGYFNDQQQPYVSDEDPARAWILCSLQGTAGGGSPMPPPSGMAEADLALVRQWAACGMRPKGDGSGAGGGGGSP